MSARTVSRIFQAFKVKSVEKIPDGDTINYFFEKLPPEFLSDIRTDMVRQLIRQKCFQKQRLLKRSYLVAVDGSRIFSFRQRHCKNCLTQTLEDGSTRYYHSILEAKLVGRDGTAVSIGTEFIEGRAGSNKKQDCELRAFYRLAEKLKQQFPRLPICLLLDGLYPSRPVFSICQKEGWKYLMTFKEGCISSVYLEYEDLKIVRSWERVLENCFTEPSRDGILRKFMWEEQIEYGPYFLNVLELEEKQEGKSTRFVWLTNFSISRKTCAELAQAARLRWKIENEGFNTQKNNGYELEHAYSEDPVGMKNFYLCLQIAHLLMQLMERGNFFKESAVKQYGSLRNFARKLLTSLTTQVLTLKKVKAIFNQRIQIRLNSS